MTTIETVDGKAIVIKWSFREIVEQHDSNWCEWIIVGEGDDGKMYGANCGADGWHPEDSHSDPENIDEYEGD